VYCSGHGKDSSNSGKKQLVREVINWLASGAPLQSPKNTHFKAPQNWTKKWIYSSNLKDGRRASIFICSSKRNLKKIIFDLNLEYLVKQEDHFGTEGVVAWHFLRTLLTKSRLIIAIACFSNRNLLNPLHSYCRCIFIDESKVFIWTMAHYNCHFRPILHHLSLQISQIPALRRCSLIWTEKGTSWGG